MGDINQDPSMEEILASIKRVIAEDGRAVANPPKARARRVPPAAAEGTRLEEDVLELSNPVREDDGLMSDNAAAASRQALAALASVRPGEEEAATDSDGPLEALVKDMLRPMLKEWLDQRLPDMVEELVTREIARITGKSL